MDHPCHRLKVAGKGLKRARYRGRSPVRQKRRGMGSYLEGGPPPPYHDPPGACLAASSPGGWGSRAWWRMGTTPPAAPSSPRLRNCMTHRWMPRLEPRRAGVEELVPPEFLPGFIGHGMTQGRCRHLLPRYRRVLVAAVRPAQLLPCLLADGLPRLPRLLLLPVGDG